MSLTGKNNEEKIWNYLKAKKLNDYAIAGIMGNMYAESGLRPDNLQDVFNIKFGYTDAEFVKAVDSGKFDFARKDLGFGMGICQWTYYSRREALLKLAKKNKKSIADLETQLDYFWQEMNTLFSSTLKKLKSVKSVRAASDIVLLEFEMPGDVGESVKKTRATYGQGFYNKYKSKSTSSSKTTSDKSSEKTSDKTTNKSTSSTSKTSNKSTTKNSATTKGGGTMTKVESAIQWMENLANNNSHGYDQIYRWGEKGDYDCSSAVISAWQQAGIPVKTNGASYTGNMYSVFTKLGFKDVTSKINISTGSGLIRGDILLNHQRHVAMYCGGGMEVEASINEKGGATGGKPGDQTGREVLIRSYRNYPWNAILRWPDSSTASTSNKSTSNSSSKSSNKSTSTSKVVISVADKQSNTLIGTWKTTAPLNLRKGAGNGTVITEMAKGSEVQCYGGYYTVIDGIKWLYVAYGELVGFCSSEYLKM